MEVIYTTEQSRTLFLYPFENRLYLRTIQNERITRPLLLCSNYQSGLSGTLYNQALYYSYLSHDNSLLVRSLTESIPVFRLDGTSTVSYSTPHLVVFADRLLFFYIEKSRDSYFLKSHALFAEGQPETLPDCFSDAPKLHVLPSGSHLYVFLTTTDTSKLFRYNIELRTEPFVTKNEFLHNFAPLLEQQHKLLSEKEQDISDAKLQLTAKEKELQSLRLSLSENEEKAHRTELLLERAKAQYAELMTVAEQYRNESIKWYEKFTGTH